MPAADGLTTNCTDLHGLFKYSACGRKEFATEAWKRDLYFFRVSVLLLQHNLPQAKPLHLHWLFHFFLCVSFSIKFVLSWSTKNK